jgi:protein involved in polysaccharide export with SLBB domain
MLRTVSLLAAAALLLAGAGRAAAQSAARPAPQQEVTLQPGDVVRVEIWREKDLSGEFQVDPDGIATLPLLGDTPVTGVPMRDLRRALIEKYGVHLRNPSISVTPLRRISVLGEVNKPGVYLVDPTTTLAEAVAASGGANASGNLKNIRILRRTTGAELRHVSAETTIDQVDLRSGDQVFVEPRNWFTRNTSFVVSVVLSVTGIVISLVR